MSGLRAVRDVEPLITKGELALLLSCSDDTVDEMRKAGMPCIRWGRRMVRFRASEAIAWFEGHGREAA